MYTGKYPPICVTFMGFIYPYRHRETADEHWAGEGEMGAAPTPFAGCVVNAKQLDQWPRAQPKLH